MNIDWNKLKKLVRIFDDSQAGELEAKTESWSVFLKKPQQKLRKKFGSGQSAAKLVTIASPKQGVFLRKLPSEDSLWVEQGEKVEKGDRLGVIHSSGVGDEIRAEQGGVVNFSVGDGVKVEQGQDLLVIQPFEG